MTIRANRRRGVDRSRPQTTGGEEAGIVGEAHRRAGGSTRVDGHEAAATARLETWPEEAATSRHRKRAPSHQATWRVRDHAAVIETTGRT